MFSRASLGDCPSNQYGHTPCSHQFEELVVFAPKHHCLQAWTWAFSPSTQYVRPLRTQVLDRYTLELLLPYSNDLMYRCSSYKALRVRCPVFCAGTSVLIQTLSYRKYLTPYGEQVNVHVYYVLVTNVPIAKNQYERSSVYAQFILFYITFNEALWKSKSFGKKSGRRWRPVLRGGGNIAWRTGHCTHHTHGDKVL